jgi:alkylated DNA nucleotide flippase Atl1
MQLTPLRKLSISASNTYGVFSVELPSEFGISRRQIDTLIANGIVERLSERALRFTSAPQTWPHRVYAACAALGPGAVAGYRSAAALHGLDGYPRQPVPIEVLVPRSQRNRTVGDHDVVVGSTNRLRDSDRTVIRGIPVATAEWTLARLGRMSKRDRVEGALDQAEHVERVSRESVSGTLTAIRGRGVAGVGKLSGILEFRDRMQRLPIGVLGRRMSRILVAAGLPAPELEYPVRKPDGSLLYLDAAYPTAFVGLEGDGATAHLGRRKRSEDHRRQNTLELSAFTVLRFTYEQVTYEPDYLVETVAAALALNGAIEVPKLLIPSWCRTA